jgi:hypothetical protein
VARTTEFAFLGESVESGRSCSRAGRRVARSSSIR